MKRPFSYERITDKTVDQGFHLRLRDADDNRLATCYDEGNARALVDQLNASPDVLSSVRTCRACGCTDLRACPGGCYWVSLDLCSACAKKGGGERLPLSAAETVARDHDFLQVIVLAWDGRQTAVATYGTTAEQSAQAAEGGNRIKRALGWPESLCNVESAKVAALRARITELETALEFEVGVPVKLQENL